MSCVSRHDPVVHGRLFEVRQQRDEPTTAIPVGIRQAGTAGPARSTTAVHKVVVHVMIIVQSQAQLLEVVLALGAAGRLARLLDGRQQEGNEDRNDRNHHEQLNQCKSGPLSSNAL